MTAQELLSSIQLSGDNVNSNNKFLQKIHNNLNGTEYDELIKRIQSDNSRMPTDYQESFFYDMIEEVFNDLKDTVQNEVIMFKNKKIQYRPIPLFGTANLNESNAFVEVEDGVPVIVFSNDFMEFIRSLLELYTKEHWLVSKKLMTSKYQDIFTRHFIDIMYCFHKCPKYSNAHIIPLDWCEIENFDDFDHPDKLSKFIENTDYFYDDTYYTFLADISNATYLWIVAHEYSHLILGHLDDTEMNTIKKHINNIEVSKIEFEWQQEYDADILGAIIVMQSSSFFAASGIYFALNCLLLSNINKNKIDYSSSSHPPVNLRINNVFDYLRKSKCYLNKYEIIDSVIIPKYLDFKNFLEYIEIKGLEFSTVFDIQKFIYKEYRLS